MKMNRTSVAAAVISAGLVASLGALAPATVSADELAAAAPAAASQPADTEDPAAAVADADADAAPSDDAAVSAVSAVALSDESAAAPEAKDSAAAEVAEFNGKKYSSFDAALADAKKTNGATIKLLADAETAGLDLDKDFTIDGDGHALKFTDKGIALRGPALVLKNVNASMVGIGSTPYTAEWNWMSVSASKDASLTLDNATLTMDGTGTPSGEKQTHAIYFGGNNKLNLKNGSNLTIKNYSQDALEWDGGDGGYNVNIEGGSTYISDHNRSGFTGTFYATIDSSTVKVLNSKGNGSNGTYFTIKNGSEVTFENSGNWGISAWRIDMSNGSKLYANDNGYSGIWTRVLNVDKSCLVDVERNGAKGTSAQNNGGITFYGNGKYKSLVENGANVTIKNNAGSGIYTKQRVCDLTIGSATITNNGTNKDGIGADMGGGVYNVGTMKLDPSVVIYNNHAANAGDDIYSTGAGVTDFGNVGTDWVLDDCDHTIDGWYVDGKDSRWSAHKEPKFTALAQPGTYEGEIAFKAAHGLVKVDYQYVGDAPANAELPGEEEGLEVGSSYTAQVQNLVDGYTFDGWYTDEACTTQWVDGTPLTGSMTLYGKWTKNPETPATPADTQKPTTNKPAKKQVKKSVPKTGDETSSALPFALFGGAAAVIGLGAKSRRRE